MVDGRNWAGVYDRESKGKGSSIDDQNRENREACEENGWSVRVRYEDKVGASRFSAKVRDGWPHVTDDVVAGRIDVLVVWEIARTDRVMDTWVPFLTACRRSGVLIHVTSDQTTYDPRIGAHRKALLEAGTAAENETEKLSVRSRKGIAGAALAGKPHGRAAWGYTRHYGPIVDGKRTFNDVPNEYAPVVKEVIERVARADPIVRIVADLNKRKIPSPTGKQWHRNSLRKVVMRPAYVGVRSHNGVHHPADWPAIVQESVWLDAVAVLTDPARRTTQPGRYKWLLSYLAVASCGAGLNAGTPPGRRRAVYRCNNDGCLGIGVTELDAFVTRVVLARLAHPNARAELLPDLSEVEQANAAVIRVRAELDELADLVALGPDNGGVSLGLAARSEPGIRARLVDTERHLSAVAGSSGPLVALLNPAVTDDAVTERVLLPRWEQLTVAGRRAVINALIERIEVRPAVERASRWTSDEDRLQLAAARTEISWRQ